MTQDSGAAGAERRQVQHLQSLQMSAIGMPSAAGQGLPPGGLLSSGALGRAPSPPGIACSRHVLWALVQLHWADAWRLHRAARPRARHERPALVSTQMRCLPVCFAVIGLSSAGDGHEAGPC